MQDNPSVTIIFNREPWELAKVLYNAQTDKETNRLKEIMAEKFPDRRDEEGPEP